MYETIEEAQRRHAAMAATAEANKQWALVRVLDTNSAITRELIRLLNEVAVCGGYLENLRIDTTSAVDMHVQFDIRTPQRRRVYG